MATGDLHATILSQLFWPAAATPPPPEGSGLRLPVEVSAAMEGYAAAYHGIKAPRKLRWRPHQGLVQLEVTVGGQRLPFHVDPPLALLLLPFRQRAAWTAAELAEETGLAPGLVVRRMVYWVGQVS